MTSVYANGRSILHKGHGMTHVCAVPDVCKTPSPGGPIPIPYVNLAQDSDLADGAKNTKIEGNPISLKSSKLGTSSGDEAGTAGGGILSSKTKGSMTWTVYSMDVQVEGQGVVRFTDAAMHNGNTFNAAFISQGGTGFAYGDDAQCPVCGKGPEKHRVLEVEETAGTNAAALVAKLMEKYKDQQPKINEFMKLRDDRIKVESDYSSKVEPLNRALEPLQTERAALVAAIAAGGGPDPRLAELMAQIKVIEAQIAPLKAKRASDLAALNAQMNAINTALKGTHVLIKDDSTTTYTKGYMIGALVCKCGTKKLAACSGPATPGFRAAVQELGFTIVEAFAQSPRQSTQLTALGRKKWDCSAPKLVQKADGHKAGSLSEKWFSPYGAATVTVKYIREEPPDKLKYVTEVFGSGVTVPSCETCQQLLPEMMCDADEPCAG